MSRIVISSNVDSGYFLKHNNDWIQSVLKNKSESMSAVLLTVGFELQDADIDCIPISPASLSHSVQRHAKGRRKNFICLETGEFVNFLEMNDSDIFILCDYDVTMQRSMNNDEVEFLNNMGDFDFAVCRDDYSNVYNLEWFFNNFSKTQIFKDIDPEWHQYNTGIQAGRVSAWKNLFNSWKEHSEIVTSNIPYHFAFQLFFSYFIQKNNLLKEMGPDFHNAHWFRDTPAKISESKNMLVVNEEPVLFYHHKFQKRPGF